MIFDFESDFAGSLRCIPMITRQKLDIVAIKMSLRQWSKLSREERAQMTEQLCSTPQQVQAYRALVLHLIATKTDEPVVPLTVQNLEDWQQTDHVPDAVLTQASSDGVSPPDLNTWQKLTPLQRFALIKLARSKHENENFVPAMKEFGILPSEK